MSDTHSKHAREFTLCAQDFREATAFDIAMREVMASCNALKWDCADQREAFILGAKFASHHFGLVDSAETFLAPRGKPGTSKSKASITITLPPGATLGTA